LVKDIKPYKNNVICLWGSFLWLHIVHNVVLLANRT